LTPKPSSEIAREIVKSFGFESDVVRGWWYEEVVEKLEVKITEAIDSERSRMAAKDALIEKLREALIELYLAYQAFVPNYILDQEIGSKPRTLAVEALALGEGGI